MRSVQAHDANAELVERRGEIVTRKRYTSEEGFQAVDLLVAARDHILATRCILRECRIFGLDSAGYLLHLAAELILKAWLLHCEGEFPESHVLVTLAVNLQSRSPVLADPETLRNLATLDKYNELRYPDPSGGVAVSEPDVTALMGFVSDVLFDALPPELQELPIPYRTDEEGRFIKDNRYLMIRPKEK